VITVPTVHANGIDIYYEVQGAGEPLVLIPYLAADQACYAFQVADYAKQYTCFTVDLRGAGLTDKPEGTYTTQLLADDVAALMQAAGIGRAHIAGLMRQSEAVLTHDATAVLSAISAPTLITFGRHDAVTSTRFAEPLTGAIAGSELSVFEDCSHAPIVENVEDFNQRTLAFLNRHSGT
jgi:pimeloyl-ACP methyl ester carboxylesterase